MKFKKIRIAVLSCILGGLLAPIVVSQTTAFNFQGRLNDGSSPANGRYDLQFKLFDALAGGNQIGSNVDRPNLMLVNGVFSTTLDFGATAFASGNRFLEIGVRPNGSPNAHVILGARQQILSVPLAVRATSAANADNATNAQTAVNAQNSVNAANAQNAATAQNAFSLGGVAASEFARLNFVNTGDLKTTGSLVIDGNARQLSTANGLVKAMIHVGRDGTIQRCYNGITGVNTGDCGFSVTLPLVGVYRIFFGFAVNQKFVSVTPEYATTCNVVPIQCRNAGANFRFIGANLEVFTFNADNAADTAEAAFIVIVF